MWRIYIYIYMYRHRHTHKYTYTHICVGVIYKERKGVKKEEEEEEDRVRQRDRVTKSPKNIFINLYTGGSYMTCTHAHAHPHLFFWPTLWPCTNSTRAQCRPYRINLFTVIYHKNGKVTDIEI